MGRCGAARNGTAAAGARGSEGWVQSTLHSTAVPNLLPACPPTFPPCAARLPAHIPALCCPPARPPSRPAPPAHALSAAALKWRPVFQAAGVSGTKRAGQAVYRPVRGALCAPVACDATAAERAPGGWPQPGAPAVSIYRPLAAGHGRSCPAPHSAAAARCSGQVPAQCGGAASGVHAAAAAAAATAGRGGRGRGGALGSIFARGCEPGEFAPPRCLLSQVRAGWM